MSNLRIPDIEAALRDGGFRIQRNGGVNIPRFIKFFEEPDLLLETIDSIKNVMKTKTITVGILEAALDFLNDCDDRHAD